DAPFLVYEDETWSFAEVMRHVDALAALLVDTYGVRRGDRVAIAMRNYPEWIVSFAAITSVGAISVSLNAWWTADALAWALDDCGATVLTADAERVARTAEHARARGLRVLGVRLGDGVAEHPGLDRWEDVLPLGAPMPQVEVTADDDATILYTSGTTGRPKGAVSTHRAVTQALLGFSCRAAVDRLRRGEAAPSAPPVFILIVPLFHVTGAVPVMLGCCASGSPTSSACPPRRGTCCSRPASASSTPPAWSAWAGAGPRRRRSSSGACRPWPRPARTSATA